MIPLFFNRSIQQLVVLNSYFCSSFKHFLFCLCCCLCISQLSSGGENEDYIKCELIGGGSPTQLFIYFCNFFFIVGCILHTHQYMLCIVVPMYAMLSKISEHNHTLLLASLLGQLQLLRGFHCTGGHYSRYLDRGSAMASFGHGNS